MSVKIEGWWSSRLRGRGIVFGLIIAAALRVVGCAASGPADPKCAENQPKDAGSVQPLPPKPDERADNSACLDCHMDFAEELIVTKHLENGFACTACHGESVAHGEDEANVTKPDVLLGRTQIGPFCKMCHPEHKSTPDYEDFVREWRGRRRPSGVMLLDDATCTDCHGRHVIIGAG